MARLMRALVSPRWLGAVLLLAAACNPRPHPVQFPHPVAGPSFSPGRLRSFTDAFPVTGVADAGTLLWAGTSHGLIRWDSPDQYTVIGTKDGLPSERIAAVSIDPQGGLWVASEKGVSRSLKQGWKTYAAAPVGDFLTGLQPSPDARVLWAGGPEGLARLGNGKWEHFLADVGVTVLARQTDGTLWIGTDGHGILRVDKDGARLSVFGPKEGCAIDVVRGLTATDHGILAVGDGPDGPRAALQDGERFFSYKVDAPAVLQWAIEASGHVDLGTGTAIYQIVFPGATRPPAAAVKLTALASSGPLRRVPRTLPLRPDLGANAIDAAESARLRRRERAPKSAAVAPLLTTTELELRLPDGVTSVGSSERGLFVGTRALGLERIDNGTAYAFRTGALTEGATRLSIACGKGPCDLATGGARAYAFDGQAFETIAADPSPNARVLAVVRDPSGAVLALARAGTGRELELAHVEGSRLEPLEIPHLEVPRGLADVRFAGFSPDGHLWVGLEYRDEKGVSGYGAAEVTLASGQTRYHHPGASGLQLPAELVAMYWAGPDDGWFATRSGAARVRHGQVQRFGQRQGLLPGPIFDIGPGDDGVPWLATARGVARFDGAHWQYAAGGPLTLPAHALAHDAYGHVFVGTPAGVFCRGNCSEEAIDSAHGLLDDDVLDLGVDSRSRVWVLLSKGITIVEPKKLER